MADYISREAAIRFFNKWVDDLNKQIDDSVGYPHLRSDYKVCKTQLLDCIHAVKEMPTAYVRPVEEAHWEDYTPECKLDVRMRCSNCGSVELPLLRWKYCPMCGAIMREVKEG